MFKKQGGLSRLTLVGGLLIAAASFGASHLCSGKTEEVPAPVVTAAPTVAPAPLPPVVWETVKELSDVEGFWGDKTTWARLTSREEGKRKGIKWRLPYPWRLQVKVVEEAKVYDCGVFERLQVDWRLGYCRGGAIDVGGEEQAERVVLHVKDGSLRVRIGLLMEVELSHE